MSDRQDKTALEKSAMSQDKSAKSQPVIRREFFWSGRTLRCFVWVSDEELGEHMDRIEDCLSVDRDRCVIAHEPFDKLIPELLNRHFESNVHEK